MNIKGTKTEENLWTAFAGESQTRNKYNFFAEAARKEGFFSIAEVFDKISLQEKEHSNIILSYLEGIKDTPSNIRFSAFSENYEGYTMYKEFERVAREEGFEEIANFFANVAKVEREHEKIFLSLLENLKNNQTDKK